MGSIVNESKYEYKDPRHHYEDVINHEEKIVGGNSDFMELLNKELEKQGEEISQEV